MRGVNSPGAKARSIFPLTDKNEIRSEHGESETESADYIDRLKHNLMGGIRMRNLSFGFAMMPARLTDILSKH